MKGILICLLAMASLVHAQGTRVVLPSVGPVELKCAAAKEWRLDLSAKTIAPGVDEVEVTLQTVQPQPPPRFSVHWFVSQRDVHHLWTSAATHYGIPWGEVMRSEISSDLPLYSFLDANDHNRFTFASSESCRRVEFRAPISETRMGFACSFTYFAVPDAPLREYRTRIRFDARREVFYGDAIGEASDWMCASAGIVPLAVPESAYEPLYSTWYTFHQDVSASLVEDELKLAAEYGMRTVIVDDGWQIDLPLGNRAWGGYHLCGDWSPGRNFPDMRAHVKRVQDMGYKYMLWYSVPFIGDKSAAYARFRGKFLPEENCCAGGWVLDPRFPEAREYLINTYEQAVRDWNLDGFKFDFIGRFTLKGDDPAAKDGYAGRDIKSIPVAVEKLMTDVTERLRALKPDILVEFRQPYIGPCIRRFGNMIRATDCPCSMVENRTRIARLRLVAGKTAIHSDMLEWRADETVESAARSVLNAIFGVVQYSVRLKDRAPAHLAMIRHWIDFSRKHRDALLKGTFRAHYPAADYPLLEGACANERVLGVYQDNLVVPVLGDKTAYVLNGANGDSLVLDLAVRPARVEVYDTLGRRVGTPACTAGVQRLAVPVSGYVVVSFHAP
ncbi:MAG: alpha-galactosidase [Kiritimatiellae bacterium]|nr:alpha-galactosidase [Kiritimatiellia bacterium]